MGRISAKRKTRAIVFYICVALVLALVWMSWGYISYGIILFLDKVVRVIQALMGG
jgi:hypothetical protein